METNFEQQMHRLEEVCKERNINFDKMEILINSQKKKKLGGKISDHRAVLATIMTKTLNNR